MPQYPSSKEREKIVARRKQLAKGIIRCLVIDQEEKQAKAIGRLSRRYGRAAVERELRFLTESFTTSAKSDDEGLIYHKYVTYYRRFGGDRFLLSPAEYSVLNLEFSELFVRQETGQRLSEREQARLSHLADLMLKDAPFWEDLVPEDPPSLMPDVELSAPPASSPDSEAVLGEHISPVCPRDGFPMLHLNGKLQCSVEYIARCVGDQQRVVDMVRQGRITYYIFENGHQLPLLCACCGQGLRVPDVVAECKQMQGRRLEAMRLEQRVTKRGRHFNELVLELLQLRQTVWRKGGRGYPIKHCE